MSHPFEVKTTSPILAMRYREADLTLASLKELAGFVAPEKLRAMKKGMLALTVDGSDTDLIVIEDTDWIVKVGDELIVYTAEDFQKFYDPVGY